MTDKEFKNLLKKYQAGHCTPEEEKLVQQWYQSFDNEDDGIRQLSQADQAAVEEKMIGKIRNQMQGVPGKRSISLRSYATISVAALFLLLIGYFSWSWIQTLSIKGQFVTVHSRGVLRKIILPDGSLVWLKGSSELKYPGLFTENALKREVWLKGEALFEVAKNPRKPFFIQCGAVVAKVVGTSFNVKEIQDEQQVEVVVLTGKVAVSGEGKEESKPLLVEPMQKAIAGPGGISKDSVHSISIYTKGTAYDMRFEETPLSEVLKRIEQKFDVKIRYKELARNCRITADFTDQSLQVTLQMMVSTLGEVAYRVNAHQVFLEGKACQ